MPIRIVEFNCNDLDTLITACDEAYSAIMGWLDDAVRMDADERRDNEGLCRDLDMMCARLRNERRRLFDAGAW